MPADNIRGATFEEHDIYMNELLKSLTTADKNGITKDPFISVKKHRSCEARVVAKCGQRPLRLSDPEKGTDNANIARKRSKPNKHGHGKGKRVQKPGI
ncbi:hypothetical protein Tco_1291249 [Tanacetum coccineum]